LAFGGASVAIVAVGAVVLLQQSAKKPGPQQQDAYALVTSTAVPAKVEQQFNEMLAGQQQVAVAQAAPVAEAERVSEERVAKRKAGRELDEVKVAAAAAPPTEAKPMPALAVAPTAPPPAGPSPASYGRQFRTITAGVENMVRASQRMRFSQVPSARGAEAKDRPQAQQQVLASFQFEQSGDRVVIVDADGSTYEGQAQLTQAAPLQQSVEFGRQVTLAKTAPAPAPTEATAKEKSEIARAVPQRGAAITRGGPAQAAAWQEQQQQQLFFTAVGTNRSLRQRVVINGTLNPADAVAGSNAAVAGQPTMLGAAGVVISNAPASAAAAPATPPQSRARVQGTFRVGDAPVVRLDAVGVGP
jgi:hypothetical protein